MSTTRSPATPQATSAPIPPFTPVSLPSITLALANSKPSSPKPLDLSYQPQPYEVSRAQKPLEFPRSPATSLRAFTGAAALADARIARLQEEARTRETTPNPDAVVLSRLLNSAGTSHPSDATSAMSDGMKKVAETLSTPATNGPGRTTSILDGTSASMTATAAPADMSTQFTAEPEEMEDGDDAAPDDNTRPFTYPGPQPFRDHDTPTRRDMSMPGGSYDSGQKSGKRHKCPYCSTDFTRHHNLKSHLLTHSQEKPYVCNTCQARFRRLHDLKRHERLHTGERNHICPKCGRKFARGDALARHNKGPGGCANRKSSFGADDEDGDEIMDGVEYDNEQDDDGQEDNLADEQERRVSEPSRKRPYPDSGNEGGIIRQPSTYPPPLAKVARADPGTAMGPPSTLVSPASAKPSPLQLPAQTPDSMHQSQYYGNTGNSYPTSQITESPRPLSPRSQDPKRLSVGDATHSRNRSPSLTSGFQSHQYTRAVPGTLAPAHMSTSHAPHLPSLPGLTGGQPVVQPGHGVSSSYGGHHHTASGSNGGSHSSHGQSSAGSIRDILGSDTQDVMAYVRNLESRFSRMQDEYELRISRLQADVIELKNQLFHRS